MSRKKKSRYGEITMRSEKMRLMTVNLQEPHVMLMEALLRFHLYPSRSEIIRVAVKNFLMRELVTARKIKDMEDTVAELEKHLPKNGDEQLPVGLRREAYEAGKKPEQYYDEIVNHDERRDFY